VQFNSAYANQGNTDYLDEVGSSVVSFARASTGGTLVFLSSYKNMDIMMNKWRASDLLSPLEDEDIAIFVEPKNAKDLETVLESYYETIDNGGKAVLLAVLRGKVSEGINFSDAYARAVVIVGIP
jgi:Rad3-related DNA helicase